MEVSSLSKHFDQFLEHLCEPDGTGSTIRIRSTLDYCRQQTIVMRKSDVIAIEVLNLYFHVHSCFQTLIIFHELIKSGFPMCFRSARHRRSFAKATLDPSVVVARLPRHTIEHFFVGVFDYQGLVLALVTSFQLGKHQNLTTNSSYPLRSKQSYWCQYMIS